jgi:hypothetical protein
MTTRAAQQTGQVAFLAHAAFSSPCTILSRVPSSAIHQQTIGEASRGRRFGTAPRGVQYFGTAVAASGASTASND